MRYKLQEYLLAAASVLGITLVGAPFLGHLDLANIVMLYPLAVLFAAIKLGRGPAVLAALLSVLLFDVFFVPPRFTLVVSDLQYLITFMVLLTTALLTAQLATGLKAERDAANHREHQTRALYEMARELSAALSVEQIARIAQRFATRVFDARVVLFVPDIDNTLMLANETDRAQVSGRDLDQATAVYTSEHADKPPAGTNNGTRFMPLDGPMRRRGVLAIVSRPLSVPLEELLLTINNLLGIALERVHFVEVARKTEVDMESERLRSSLLAALSHDLRTPMAAISGLAETIKLTPPPLAPPHGELIDSIRTEALRTNALMNNLLEMARLQATGVSLRREWLPIEELVGSALGTLSSQLTRHELEISIPHDLPLIEVDGVLMERVIGNIVENAVKYTPPGSTINIVADADASFLELRFCDDGPGLPMHRGEELFEKFTRGKPESNISGVGLGLAIVHTIVKAHGGILSAHNLAGGGACFTVRLPLGDPPSLGEETLSP